MKNYIVNELIAAMKERIPRGINADRMNKRAARLKRLSRAARFIVRV